MRANGCPDLGPDAQPDGDVIWVGSGGTDKERHAFDQCPGAYLRTRWGTALYTDLSAELDKDPQIPPGAVYYTVDGVRTAAEITRDAHFAWVNGQAPPMSPLLMQAVQEWDRECIARENLRMEAQANEAKAADVAARYPSARLVATA